MNRISTSPRHDWQSQLEKLGFGYHSTDLPYWDESAYYTFTSEEVTMVEHATATLWDRCLEAVQHVINHNLYHLFQIPEAFIPLIERSWDEDHPSIYGRFDFAMNQGVLKMLEFNADTPTSLFEASIVQWYWLQDIDKSCDQYNSIHEHLIDYWKYLKGYLYQGILHFTCLSDTLEDLSNTEYMRDCAIQAGLHTKFLYIDEIGWNDNLKCFVDTEEQPIRNIFKLYPWEWIAKDEFGTKVLEDHFKAYWIEPAWKMILSNKAILPLLYELFPDCPYLLPSYFDANHLAQYVRKPLLSREGANVDIVINEEIVAQSEGEYGDEGFVYQEYFPLPDYEGNFPIIGSWLIGGTPAGMGIRESRGLITDNQSRFIPHLIKD